MKIGIVGTGNMGQMLVEAFIESKTVQPNQLVITNRTLSKLMALKEGFPQLIISENAVEVAQLAKLIFICVKPADMFPIFQQISPVLKKEQCVVSITSPVNVTQLEGAVPCSAARIIPSITNQAFAGVSLITFGSRCADDWKQRLWHLMNGISTPFQIDENITRVASDIVSCGPAFFTYLLQRFIEAAVAETNIDEHTALELGSEMFIGLGELLKKKKYTLQALQEKVTVQGGVTGVGIKVLEQELGEIFHHLIQGTHKKFADDINEINKQFTP